MLLLGVLRTFGIGFHMEMNDILHKLNRKKIFIIVVAITAYVYSMIQWIYPMMNAKSTTTNITGGLASVAMLLLLTYVIPKIINYQKN
jgi:hypothetical protein